MEKKLRDPLDQALEAAASGPFFPDWEFEMLFGMSRVELSALIGTITAAPASEQQLVGIGNAVNNLLGYPHGQEGQWSHWFGCTPSELESAYHRWRSAGQSC